MAHSLHPGRQESGLLRPGRRRVRCILHCDKGLHSKQLFEVLMLVTPRTRLPPLLTSSWLIPAAASEVGGTLLITQDPRLSSGVLCWSLRPQASSGSCSPRQGTRPPLLCLGPLCSHSMEQIGNFSGSEDICYHLWLSQNFKSKSLLLSLDHSF